MVVASVGRAATFLLWTSERTHIPHKTMRNQFTTRNQWFTETIETTRTSGRPS
ncbi:MAG: hypothetical protein KBF75_02720 [Saprospiraceae bacterium]|nr:hypothetical protein [Saprospiraceae bacterium]